MIFPKNEHLKITMYANALLGLWPFIFEDNPLLHKLYNIYSKCIITYYLLYIISAIIKIIFLICDEVMIIGEIMVGLSTTLLYSVIILRAYAIKTPRVKAITREIIVLEERILRSGDEKIIEIYNSYVKQSQMINKIYLASIFVNTPLFYIRALFADDLVKYYASRNETVIEKSLPLPRWYPFDEQKYYLQSYLWQILDGAVGASFVTYTDIFSFSLIIFPLGQMKILTHILSNFEKYVTKIKYQINCSREEASFLTLRECSLKHKELIWYINEFNIAMRNIMVLDFLQSSLELASLVLCFLVVEMNLVNFLFSVQSACCMFIRLLVYYWYGNEILENSSNIGIAVYASKWYEEPEGVKKLFVIIMMRCNRILGLEIGPFNTMSLATFLGILKATYSYMTLIYGNQ